MDASIDRLRELYSLMCLERRMSEIMAGRNRRTQSKQRPYLISIHHVGSRPGQEAVAPAVCLALRRLPDGADPPDMVSEPGGKHFTAMGMDPGRLVAEAYGRSGGYCKGRAGPSLVSSLEHGVFGHQGVIGADFGLACGFAMVAKWRKTGQVIVCGFGDGASNQGRFHEAANFAAVNNLPVLFVCVNNHYATSMPVWKSVATENIAERARGYGIRGETFDGNDAVEAHLAALSAVEHVRSGDGPAMLEYKTFRLSGQSIADSGDYLDQDRLAHYRGRDPLTLFQERARKEQWFGDEELIAIDREALQAAEAAFVFADASPLPDPAELEDNDELGPPPAVAEAAGNQPDTPPESGRRLTYAAAISEAQRQAMEADPNAYVIGEDIGVFGGHGGPTRGLIERFGDQRVINTPIIEGTFTGAAIATSVMGYRPIVDEGMMSYMMPAIDETANVLANSRYVSGDQYTLPVTVRTNLAGGGGPSFGATNTQSWPRLVPARSESQDRHAGDSLRRERAAAHVHRRRELGAFYRASIVVFGRWRRARGSILLAVGKIIGPARRRRCDAARHGHHRGHGAGCRRRARRQGD